MSLFGTSSSLNPDIEKATNENNTTEKWGLIMDICDKVNSGTATPKECLKSIIKRLNHANPHVVMKAITLLDACVNNCGKQFHLEVASREFETEFKKLLQKSQPKVTTKLKLSLKRWAEEAFKSDPQLDLIPSLYKKLREEGHDFNDPSATPKRETPLSKDPNVVSSQQEEDDIAKAIELSLKEAKISQSPKMSSTAASGPSITSLYPSTLLSAAPVPEPRKVRALYDFEAAEDNELTFQAGEIIMVLDDSDPNWWKGQNQRGEGLFPSNFVTADLSVEPESLGATGQGKGSKKSVQFSDDPKEDGTGSGNEKDAQLQKLPVVEINEEKINRLLHLIHEADPQDPSQDTEEMLQLEQLVNQMGPLIDAELERVDRKHAQLTQLSSDLVDAINLYHNLMREPDRSMMMSMGGGPAGGAYGMTGGPGGLGAYPGAPMPPPMYGMPGMYGPPNLPGAGMYPMGPGHQQQQQPPMSGYSMGQLRHDMGQMNVAPGMPQFPAPPQQSSLPHLPHHHPVSSVSQNGPTNSGMAPVATSMAPGVSSQPTTQPAPPPQSMPNMTVPQMTPQSLPPAGSHMQQSAIPQGYANPTSPPPTGMSGPGVPPTQLRPSGPLSYHQNYGPQPSPQQQPQPQPVPQSGPPPQQQPQHVVPVTGSGMGIALTATTQPANMNHHPHLALNGVASGGSGPAMGHYPPAPSTSGPGSMPPSQMPPHHHQQHLHQQQPQQTFIMPPMGGPPQPMGGYPMGPMVGGMFPSGPVVTSGGGPLSINTNPGPQNIPIYQQQR